MNNPDNKPDIRRNNLRSPYTHEEAAEMGKKGGKSSSPAKKFINRKYCNKGCPYYDHCPAITISQNYTDKNGKHPCVIKKKNKEVQNYFINLFENGREGLVKIALDLHFRLLLTSCNAAPKDLRKTISTTLELKKAIYGDKPIEDTSQDTTIKIMWASEEDHDGRIKEYGDWLASKSTDVDNDGHMPS